MLCSLLLFKKDVIPMSVDVRGDARWKVYIHIVPKYITGYDWDKYYVGITSRNVNDRWRNGKGYIYNDHFYRAIKKYGWDNMVHEVIAENLTKEEVCDFEKRLIKELKANDYNYGYNISAGGEGCTGLSGEKNPNYGRKWSNEQRKRMSEYRLKHPPVITEEGKRKRAEFTRKRWENPEYRASMSGINAPCYGRTGEKHPMYGKHGKEHGGSKKVVCLNTNEVFMSAMEASKSKKANYSKLCMVCRGERKTCGKDLNGQPLHWKYYEDYIEENNLTDDEARESLFFIE